MSPYNPDAWRVDGGIWNAHVLPVMEWEIAERGVVIAADLQMALGIDTPVLRWRRSKHEQVAKEHVQPIEQRVLGDLSTYLISKPGEHVGMLAVVPTLCRPLMQPTLRVGSRIDHTDLV